MMLAWICAGLIAGNPASDPTSPPDPAATYREVRDKAGRSPEEQVKLALWCEAHGLTAERLHHLTLAVLADPKNVAARGLMGLVSHEGRWRRPEAIADQARVDPILAEYELKRQKAAYTADAQWALGLWAGEHGLPEQAKAHLTAVIRLDPSREAAWKKLGYRRYEGRWRTDTQVAAEKAEIQAQERADHRWTPVLTRWKGWLEIADKRAEAESGLDGVTDPRAVASVVKVFGPGGPSQQVLAVRLLGQIDAPASSRALAMLATWGKSPDVRRAAAETLSHRDPREFLGLLIGRLRKPMRYEMGLNPNLAGPRFPYFAVEGENSITKINSTIAYEYPFYLQPGLLRRRRPAHAVRPLWHRAAQMYANSRNLGRCGLDAVSARLRELPRGEAASPRRPAHSLSPGRLIDPANAMVYQATYAASVRDAQIAQILNQGPNMGPNFVAQTSALMGQIDAYNASVRRTKKTRSSTLRSRHDHRPNSPRRPGGLERSGGSTPWAIPTSRSPIRQRRSRRSSTPSSHASPPGR